jgi:hypothetical protein
MGEYPLMANPALPSLEFLLTCSMTSLQDLELAGLNRSDQHFKAAKLELAEALAQREIAGVARFMIDHRDKLLERARQTIEAQTVFEFPRKTA